jgi:hypothetical protein
MKCFFALAVLFAALLGSSRAACDEPPPPTAEPPPPATEPSPPAPDADPSAQKKAQAEARFYKGLQLFREQLWDAALAEFLESRTLHATRAATRNAALCLRKLGRFDEALDLLDALLREFPTLSPEERGMTERELVELRGLVGTIEVRVSEAGAVVLVDGRERGTSPVAPFRVVAGTRALHVYRDGFLPYRTTVQVAGGNVAKVNVALRALGVSGRLKIGEQRGAIADVVVDGVIVGRTPWEGALAAGAHVVTLRGDTSLGSQPAAAPVRQGEVTRLTLTLEPLESELVVMPTPRHANVSIDGVALGRGAWRGRLRAGAHTLDVTAAGYVSSTRRVSLAPGATTLEVELDRDRTTRAWDEEHQPRIVLDAAIGPLVGTGLGGEVADNGCDGECSRTPGYGVAAWLHGGYQFGIGIALLLEVGFLEAHQRIDGRLTTLKERPVAQRIFPGRAQNELRLRGALVGAAMAYSAGSDWTWTVRLGTGVLVGGVMDERSGTFGDGTASYDAAPLDESHGARLFYVTPEVRVGWRFVPRAEISLGAHGLILVPLEQVSWQNERDVTTSSFFGFYDEETLLGPSFLFAPTVGARVDF